MSHIVPKHTAMICDGARTFLKYERAVSKVWVKKELLHICEKTHARKTLTSFIILVQCT